MLRIGLPVTHLSMCLSSKNSKNSAWKKEDLTVASPTGFEPVRPKALPYSIAGQRVNHSAKVT